LINFDSNRAAMGTWRISGESEHKETAQPQQVACILQSEEAECILAATECAERDTKRHVAISNIRNRLVRE
jgi:hypothetical protein